MIWLPVSRIVHLGQTLKAFFGELDFNAARDKIRQCWPSNFQIEGVPEIMTSPLFRDLLLVCIFALLILAGCDGQNQPSPETKEKLRREQAEHEAALRREQTARAAAEKAAKEAETSKEEWQLACFATLSIATVVVVAVLITRSSHKSSGSSLQSNAELQRPLHKPNVSDSKPITVPSQKLAVPDQVLPIVAAQQIKGVYIIDGLNIARSYHYDNVFRIETLIILCIKLCEAGARFLCVFDANGIYVASGTNDPIQRQIYEKLIRDYHRCFVNVTGGSSADEFILVRADSTGAIVISNDRFAKPKDNHVQRYPWVLDSHRLVKGRVMGDRLSVPALCIDTPVVKDIYAATQLLYKLTQKKKAA